MANMDVFVQFIICPTSEVKTVYTFFFNVRFFNVFVTYFYLSKYCV